MKYKIQFFEYSFNYESRKLEFLSQRWKTWKNYKSKAGAEQAIKELRQRDRWVSELEFPKSGWKKIIHLYRYRIVEK